MILLYPNTLFLFLALPLLILAQLREYHFNRNDLRKFGNLWDNENIRSVFFVKWFLSSLCLLLTFSFFVLSLSGLSWEEDLIKEDRLGIDVIYLVDVSYSMLARDVQPDRLGRARELVRELSENIAGSRVGLVAFKGDGTLLLPPTEDVHALENVLNFLNTEVISTPGSNLESALNKALESFPQGINTHRIIVLFSDGESLSGNSDKAILEATQEGIPIFTYGLGSIEGAVIPQGGDVLKKGGQAVITRLNSTALKEISRLTKGMYFESPAGSTALSNEIISLVQERDSSGFRLVSIAQYRIFLFFALISYAAYFLIRSIKIKGLF